MAASKLPRLLSLPETDDLVVHGDNLEAMARLPDGAFDVIYADPPFGTGARRAHTPLRATRAADGGRRGFAGHRYATAPAGPGMSYDDRHADYLDFLMPRLRRARELLAAHGTLYLHLDYRQAHAAKLALDALFGPECFLNELIWAYDYGAKPRRRWPAKHDTILVYVRDPSRYHFDADAVERVPYMAPGLVTVAQRARGKRPTDTWWHTIVPTNGAERTGYPTQKPEGIVRRMVCASSRPGGWCLDPFAGSGTLGAVCAALGRRYVLIDSSSDAVAVMIRRLAPARPSRAAAAGS